MMTDSTNPIVGSMDDAISRPIKPTIKSGYIPTDGSH